MELTKRPGVRSERRGARDNRPVSRKTLPDKVAFLSRTSSYGDGSRVDVIETHFAWVFLTAKHAYKLKKPLRQKDMDYRTLAQREQGCRDELMLNRRLAPTVYLAVVPLSSTRHGALQLGPGAHIEDWLVKMRRLPASRMLEQILLQRTLRPPEIHALIAMLACFFAEAQRRPSHPSGYIARLRGEIRANHRAFRLLAARTRKLADRVRDAQVDWLNRAGGTLASRAACLVEGHGDLRPEHICLERSPCVIDCLEFDPRLRRLDPFDELAFLALEVERLGHAALSRAIVQRFGLVHGECVSPALMHFYMSHRATTRAKLATWHLGDPQFPNPRPWQARTFSYLKDAFRHARRALELTTPSQTFANRSLCVPHSGQRSNKGANDSPLSIRATA